MQTIEPKEGAGDFGRPPQPSAPRAKSLLATPNQINPFLNFTQEEFRALDEFHQCAAIVLQRKGRAIIEGVPA